VAAPALATRVGWSRLRKATLWSSGARRRACAALHLLWFDHRAPSSWGDRENPLRNSEAYTRCRRSWVTGFTVWRPSTLWGPTNSCHCAIAPWSAPPSLGRWSLLRSRGIRHTFTSRCRFAGIKPIVVIFAVKLLPAKQTRFLFFAVSTPREEESAQRSWRRPNFESAIVFCVDRGDGVGATDQHRRRPVRDECGRIPLARYAF